MSNKRQTMDNADNNAPSLKRRKLNDQKHDNKIKMSELKFKVDHIAHDLKNSKYFEHMNIDGDASIYMASVLQSVTTEMINAALKYMHATTRKYSILPCDIKQATHNKAELISNLYTNELNELQKIRECAIELATKCSFTLMAYKYRIGQTDRSSEKYLFIISDGDDNFYYRMWRGIPRTPENKYIIVHPVKYIKNTETANKYIDAFNYKTNDMDKYLNDFNNILTAENKVKIMQNVIIYCNSQSLEQFIKYCRFINTHASIQTILNDDIVTIRENAWKNTFSYESHYLRRNAVDGSNYISQSLCDAFPFSDIESVDIVSDNYGESDIYFSGDLLDRNFHELNEWLAVNQYEKISDAGWESSWEIRQDCLFYKKLAGIFINEKQRAIFEELRLKIEWNRDIRMPYFEAIQSTQTEVPDNIIEIILIFIAPTIDTNVLKQRRLDFWSERMHGI